MSPVRGVDDLLTERTVNRTLVAALHSVPPDHRRAVLLSVVDGYTYEEIADIVHKRRGTVASWVHRGRNALRVNLTAHGWSATSRPACSQDG